MWEFVSWTPIFGDEISRGAESPGKKIQTTTYDKNINGGEGYTILSDLK